MLVDLVTTAGREAGRVGFVSVKVDCADSGRGGIFCDEGAGTFLAAAALFWAAIVSLRLGRCTGAVTLLVKFGRERFSGAGAALGLLESFSNRAFDLVSSDAMILTSKTISWIFGRT